tara:strand:+ start:9203 stop:10114 length:912 start_codon:yes stop_codon:yes gene_type:complete
MNHHIPIMKDEVVDLLDIKSKGIYMDCTIGFGGHSLNILNKLDPEGYLIGMDLDPYALDESRKKLKKHNNFSLHNQSYSAFPQILEKMGIEKVDGFLFDLGISSHQVDSEHRGFSYMKDSPLDMRFNNDDNNQLTAQDIINSINLERLVFAFKEYTNLKNPRFIARKLIEYRKTRKIDSTLDLRNAIKSIINSDSYKVLSQIFQAIRIIVNNEIDTIKKTLTYTLDYLKIGGRIAIISFHSVEDRIVKHFFKNQTIYKNNSYEIEYQNLNKKLKTITKKPIYETKTQNSRSRSAKLRVAERIL